VFGTSFISSLSVLKIRIFHFALLIFVSSIPVVANVSEREIVLLIAVKGIIFSGRRELSVFVSLKIKFLPRDFTFTSGVIVI